MKRAFSLLEIIVVLVIVGILFLFSFPREDNNLSRATDSLLNHISYTRHLALNDDLVYTSLEQTKGLKKRFKSINTQALLEESPMWQIQFHLSGKYTFLSYSIYVDTPRYAINTHYDGRPMAGDVIAIEGDNRRCLSGYNNTNISDECKNNSSVFVRLHEAYGLKDLQIQSDDFCREKRGARIYFDGLGVPYCSKEKKPLKTPFKIILTKKDKSKVICILPFSGYVFLSKKGDDCEKNSYSL